MQVDKELLLETIINNDIKPDLVLESNKIYFTQSMKSFLEILMPERQPKSSYSFTILNISDDRRRMA